MASGGNPGKIRSACDTCHRLKVKCSGHVPCEGCLNSGSSCFYSYSGRLGRPRGTKNRRPAGHEDTSMGNAPEVDKEASSGQESPSRTSDQYRTHPFGQTQQPSVHQISDDFASSDSLGNSTALFDSILDEGASGSSFAFNDTRQRRELDGRGFDFTEFLAMNEDMPSGLGSSSKVACPFSFTVKIRTSIPRTLLCLHMVIIQALHTPTDEANLTNKLPGLV